MFIGLWLPIGLLLLVPISIALVLRHIAKKADQELEEDLEEEFAEVEDYET